MVAHWACETRLNEPQNPVGLPQTSHLSIHVSPPGQRAPRQGTSPRLRFVMASREFRVSPSTHARVGIACSSRGADTRPAWTNRALCKTPAKNGYLILSSYTGFIVNDLNKYLYLSTPRPLAQTVHTRRSVDVRGTTTCPATASLPCAPGYFFQAGRIIPLAARPAPRLSDWLETR